MTKLISMYCDYVQLNLLNVMIYSHLCIFSLQSDDKIVLFLFKSANRMLHCRRIFFSEYIKLLDMKKKPVSLAYLLEILLAHTNKNCTKFVKIRLQSTYFTNLCVTRKTVFWIWGLICVLYLLFSVFRG